MRVADLIRLLESWQSQHGPNAQVMVPRSQYQRNLARNQLGYVGEFGEDIFIQNEPIATYLDSKGPEVEW